MNLGGKLAATLLFAGDLAAFAAALWVTLALRTLSVPDAESFFFHLWPFSAVFALFALVFYMTGLYGKRFVFSQRSLVSVIFGTQLINIALAALFFFFVPGIPFTPRASLLLYLAVSLPLILAWRLILFPSITRPGKRAAAALIGEGKEVTELADTLNGNGRFNLKVTVRITPAEYAKDPSAAAEVLARANVKVLIADIEHETLKGVLPNLYELAYMRPGYDLVPFYDAYEEVFDRVPLSLLSHDWLSKNLKLKDSGFTAVGKRIIDLIGGSLMGAVTIVLTPFIALALRLEGRGPVFIAQQRLGLRGKRITAYKFRSMTFHDAKGAWVGEGQNKITRVGAVLRRTSLDEFPQFWNIVKGEISLVGPRNDIEGLAVRLGEAIPYYNLRYVVVPGITGWAQINQQYEPGNISPQSIEETKHRLAYDFYYIKHRSLALDIIIGLKTVHRMFFRVSGW